MLLVIGAVLVFFPASLALVLHDRFVKPVDTTGKKWMWYGAYSAVISWVLLAAKLVRNGGADDILAAFGSIRMLTLYGLLAIVTAILAPLLLSLAYLLLGKASNK